MGLKSYYSSVWFKRARWPWIFVAGLVLCLAGRSLWAGDPGSSSSNFLKLGIGARAVGLGEAFTAVADDVSTIYWNPAGLSQIHRHEMMVMHHNMVEDIDHNFAAYAIPLGPHQALGLGLSQLNYGDIKYRDGLGNRLGSRSAGSDLSLGVSYGRGFEFFKAGVTSKFIQEKRAGKSASTWAADVGVLVPLERVLTGLAAGLAIQNLGPGIQFDSGKSPLPRQARFGVAYKALLLRNPLLATGETVFPSDNDLYFLAGLEYKLMDLVSLRMGFRSEDDVADGLRLGAGLGTPDLSFDYAFVPFGVFGDVHRFSVTFRFGEQHGAKVYGANLNKRMRRARIEYAKGDFVEAHRWVQHVLAMNPVHMEALDLKNKIAKAFGQAEKTQQAALVKASFQRGVTHFEKARFGEAGEAFENVLSLEPDHKGARQYRQKIQSHYDQIRKETAKELMGQGQRHFEREEYLDAIAKWKAVLGLLPKDSEAQDKIAEAETLIEVALKRAESAAAAEKVRKLLKSAKKYFGMRKDQQVIEKLQQALSLSPKNQDVLSLMQKARQRLGEDLYQQGLKLKSVDDKEAALAKFQGAAAHGHGAARKEAEKLGSVIANRRAHRSREAYVAGMRALVEGDNKTASKHFERAIQLDVSNLSAKQALDNVRRKVEP